MKKVGIATMYGGANYGNVLQNYAVQELLRQQDCEALTLVNETRRGYPDAAKQKLPLLKRLRPSYLAEYRRTRLFERYGCKNDRDCRGSGLKQAKKQAAALRAARDRRAEKFERTRQTCLHLSEQPINALQYNRAALASYDAFVCGSDQVWNPYFHQNSPIDFLQFAPAHKRIAFVPSFGVSELPPSRTAEFAAYIDGIPQLSVREQAGAALIKQLTGRDAQVLLDPTFGVSAQAWQAFARQPQTLPARRYVLCYFLGNECRAYSRWIDAFARERQLDVLNICDITALEYYDADPQEFVWLLLHAEAVFTDSFHGTAFSVNLEKPFVVFPRVGSGASMSSRITTVLERTGLTQRVFPQVSYEQVEAVDFSKARQVIAVEREKMTKYLENSLAAAAKPLQPLLATHRHCTGCGACVNACPRGALRLCADAEGFAYPQLDAAKCIGCGACEPACPADTLVPDEAQPQAYYAYADDAALCAKSSSGGVFSLLAQEIIDRGGVVFGAGFDGQLRVCHKPARTMDELAALRTSKYVQSDIGDTYRQAKQALLAGQTVLFTGTPCQIAGLHSFLGKPCENLYTQDIICHGVPSPEAWRVYLEQCHSGRQPQQLSFRDKTFGWRAFAMRVRYRDGGSYCVRATRDPFEKAFLANLSLRPSCYQCQYKTLHRSSDLTLADYWGVEQVHPTLAQQQGVSLIVVHTPKGQALLESVRARMTCEPTELSRAIHYNHAALNSTAWHKNRNTFFAKLQTEPFPKLVNRCLRQPLTKKLRRSIKRVGSRIKHMIKRK